MSERASQVASLVAEVRARLNRQLWWRTLRWALLAGGAVLLVVAVSYVARGERVPPMWYPLVLGLSVLAAAGLWWARRWSEEAAADFADRFFELHDGLISRRGFEREQRDGGFYTLQAAQVERAVAGLDPGRIRPRPARKLTLAAAAVVAVAAALGLKGPSVEVLEREARARQVQEQTGQIKAELEAYVQDLLDEAEDDEAELIEPSKLRQWVDELEQTEAPREALRQYARFQQEISRMSARLERRRDEALLAEAGQDLQQRRELEALGQKLERKQYEQASEELEQMTPEQLTKPADLDREQADLVTLQAAAERLARAARRFEGARGSEGGPGAGADSSGSAADADDADTADDALEEGIDDAMDEDLAGLLEELEEDVAEYDAALGECAACMAEQGEVDDELMRLARERGEQAADRLARLRDRLDGLEASRRARDRLAELRRRLGQCQSRLSDPQRSALARSDQPGGKRAGEGADPDSPGIDSNDPSKGNPTRLEGRKGAGPSLTTVEDAESGTGVSRRRATAQEYAFRRQVESFVEREDVPEPVRDGVKHYFQNIHQAGEGPSTEQPQP